MLRDVALEAHGHIRLARPVVLDRDRPRVLRCRRRYRRAFEPQVEPVAQPQIAVLGRRDREIADVVLPHTAPDQLLDVREVVPESELRARGRVVLELGLLLLGRRRRRLRRVLPTTHLLLCRGGRCHDHQQQTDQESGAKHATRHVPALRAGPTIRHSGVDQFRVGPRSTDTPEWPGSPSPGSSERSKKSKRAGSTGSGSSSVAVPSSPTRNEPSPTSRLSAPSSHSS